jgi:chromate transporter
MNKPRNKSIRILLKPRIVLREPRLRVWFRLLWMFLKVNLLSPSGPASIGLLYDEAVGRIMTEEQFVEAVGFSNFLPGSEALKLAMFVGFTAGGIPGMLAALLGSILPPTVMMLIVAAILENFQQETWLQDFVAGLSPAVAALILIVAWQIFSTGRTKHTGARTLLIAVSSGVALWFDIPSPFVLLGAGVMGLILFR